jgi:hypothetical protein
MVVVGMACALWVQAARYKTLVEQHTALKRRFDGMIEIVTSTGLITVTKTSPGEYFVDTGPVAKELWKKVGNSEPVTSEALAPGPISRPDP